MEYSNNIYDDAVLQANPLVPQINKRLKNDRF